jgi:hypothetical protein
MVMGKGARVGNEGTNDRFLSSNLFRGLVEGLQRRLFLLDASEDLQEKESHGRPR